MIHPSTIILDHEHEQSRREQCSCDDICSKSGVDESVQMTALQRGSEECVKITLLSSYLTFTKATSPHRTFLTSLKDECILRTSDEALTMPHSKKAMEEELRALEENQTWEVVKLPSHKKPIHSRWVFTIKYLSDESIEQYKARLVAQGYTETHGIDYGETFAPGANMNTIRFLIFLAAHFNWPLLQNNVKDAFLHGTLEDEICIKKPPGYFNVQSKTNDVCKLKKA